MQEEWREVDGWPDYRVSNLGQIWSNKRNRPLVAKADEHTYPKVTLTRDGHYQVVPVHRIVALAFVDGYFEGAFVNHIDGKRNNNRADNLEWVTHSENMRHAQETGLLNNRRTARQWTQEEWDEMHP